MFLGTHLIPLGLESETDDQCSFLFIGHSGIWSDVLGILLFQGSEKSLEEL